MLAKEAYQKAIDEYKIAEDKLRREINRLNKLVNRTVINPDYPITGIIRQFENIMDLDKALNKEI